ncbi:CxxC-x17-CxxC domain-containing protein [Methanolobus sp. ZRKC3]|uniref:CxxC-x17-CxxC domain-containing protein n=1 Tax=Methanolobus sp. ZRKC3 TaxID=3125786 RepID=UPI00324E1003
MKKVDFKGPRDMHKTKCSDCGQATEVPFVPDADRPVYCRDCFPKHKPPKKE